MNFYGCILRRGAQSQRLKRERLGVILLERLFNKPCDPGALSPLTLAFIGDGVFDLFVREQLVCQANCPVGVLHSTAVKSVCCQAQAEGLKKLLPILTEEELSVYKRGRNAHTARTPKNASSAEYHAATGLEALFGYLYLKGEIGRLRELFDHMRER
jgi:ribonuclease-3 family protein